MITNTVGGDPCFVFERRAFGSGGHFAVGHGVTGCLKEGQRSGKRSSVLLFGGHVGSVDGVALRINRVGDFVAFVGRLRSSPGRVGDRVVDDRCGVSVVGVDRHLSVNRKDGRQSAAEVLGSVRIGHAADVQNGRAHTDITVAEVVDRVDSDLLAVQRTAVGFLDGLDLIERERRIGDVDGAGDDAVQFVIIGHALLEVDVFGLGSALEEVFVRFEVDDTVFELDELVGAGAHRLRGLRTDGGKVALVKAELVVGVVVLRGISVVVHRGNRNGGEVVDRGGVDFGGGNGHTVRTGLDDARDGGSGFVKGDRRGGELFKSGEQIINGGTCGLGVDHVRDGGTVRLFQCIGEVLHRAVLGNLKSPVAGSGGNRVFGIFRVRSHELDDFFRQSESSGVVFGPERGLFLLRPVGEVGVVSSGFVEQVEQGVHTVAVFLHPLDRQSEEGSGTVVGRIAEGINRKDNVVDRDGRAVRELQIFTEREGVVNGAVLILGDGQVGGTVVGVLGAVVRGFRSFDALLNNVALTVIVQKRDLRHRPDVLVVRSLGEERRELLVERRIPDDERGFVRGIFVFLLTASGEDTDAHHHSENKREDAGGFFHGFFLLCFIWFSFHLFFNRVATN